MANFKDFVKNSAKNFVDQGINSLLGDVFGASGPEHGFNVNNLITSLNTTGVAKTSDFEVWIYGPSGLKQELVVRADTADIPGRNLIVTDHKFTGVGPMNRIPTGQTYTDVSISFLLSEDLREKEYFEQWQEKIMNTGVNEGSVESYKNNADVQTNMLEYEYDIYNTNYTNSNFRYKYFDSYIGKVEIRQYGSGGRLASIHTLNEAYPISIAPISMNWGDESAAKLQVTFAYKNYKAVFNKQNQPKLGFGLYFNLGNGNDQFGIKLPEVGSVSYTKGSGFDGNVNQVSKTIFKSAGGTGSTSVEAGVAVGNAIPLNDFNSYSGSDAIPPNYRVLESDGRTNYSGD